MRGGCRGAEAPVRRATGFPVPLSTLDTHSDTKITDLTRFDCVEELGVRSDYCACSRQYPCITPATAIFHLSPIPEATPAAKYCPRAGHHHAAIHIRFQRRVKADDSGLERVNYRPYSDACCHRTKGSKTSSISAGSSETVSRARVDQGAISRLHLDDIFARKSASSLTFEMTTYDQPVP